MGEGWIPLSGVSMPLSFLEFLILVLEVGSAFQNSQYYSSAFICGAGFHVRYMLGGHRAGQAYLGAFCLCVPGSAESQAWTRSKSGEIYADTWFHIWKCWGSVMILSIVVIFFSKTSTYLAVKRPSFQTPWAFQRPTLRKRNGFTGSGHKVKFSSVFGWKNPDLCRSISEGRAWTLFVCFLSFPNNSIVLQRLRTLLLS